MKNTGGGGIAGRTALALATGCALLMTACGGSGGNLPARPTPTPSSTPTASPTPTPTPTPARPLLTGQAALGDWTTDAPGVRRRITPADLPPPFDTPSVGNGPRIVARPAGAWPQAPDGFTVERFADGMENPRLLLAAPNGDVLVAESGAGRVRVLRDADGDGRAETVSVFASGRNYPFGLALWPSAQNPQYLYIADSDAVVRYRYSPGDLTASGPAEQIVGGIPAGGGHDARGLALSPDGRRLYLGVGSVTNAAEGVNDLALERGRTIISAYELDAAGRRVGDGRVFASGLRNPSGLTVNPANGDVWTAVNERDALGDDQVPDFVARVPDGGFYGWPWFFIGPNQDPRHPGARQGLAPSVLVPDVLLQAHSAALGIAFYDGPASTASGAFPAGYRGHAFVALHGSWNRSRRTGYKVVRVPVDGAGRAVGGEYEDFLTGFVASPEEVWGRPVGVAVGMRDGALYVSDDGGNVVWRVRYTGTR